MSQHYIVDGPHSLDDLLQSAIARCPQFFGRNVQVDVEPEAVVIRGVVGSYYHKQLAQESLRPLVGKTQIHNRLEVMTTRVMA